MQIAINSNPGTGEGFDNTCDVPYWAACDSNYNILGVVDSTGILRERYQYTPYGQRTTFITVDEEGGCWAPIPTGLGPNSICEFGHQGLMHDEEIGLVYNRARMLSPALERFLQRDPVGYVDGMNLYQYVRGRPVSFTDPTGKNAVAIRLLDLVKYGPPVGH